MCGISGYLSVNSIEDKTLAVLEELARNKQAQRGPDSFGSYHNGDSTVVLFHNRLSLVDLSSSGDQPMRKHGLEVVFNGEIYNFRELKAILVKNGYTFFSSTDTEVILSAYDFWGEEAFIKFNGAYAIALYNSVEKTLTLVRDKVGEKPLYYVKEEGKIYFASTIELLQSFTKKKFSLNTQRLLSDLVFNFWSDKSETHFNEVSLLPPGTLIRINHSMKVIQKKYWDLVPGEVSVSESEAVDTIEELLMDSVKMRVDLDTDIGSILSGGIDSSLITILAQKRLPYPVETFTLLKDGHVDDDTYFARKLSDEYGLKNSSVGIDSNDLSVSKIKSVTKSMEEPILDQVYIYLNRNYEEAHKRGLKAVLNGQASDEIFLGYLDYYPFLRNSDNYNSLSTFRNLWYNSFPLKDFIKKDTVMNVIEENLVRNYQPYASDDHLNSVLRFGVKTHMPALLIQEDKQSMRWSVECRTVYTDYRLVDYLSRVPSSLKYLDGKEKYLLREVAKKHLPKYIIEREKLGFPNLPDGRHELIRKCLADKLPEESQILKKYLKQSAFNEIAKMPFPMQWKLCSIAIFERYFS